MDHVDNTPEVYRKREQQERDLARAAQDIAVRNIHLELAQSYKEQREAAQRKQASDAD
jgi:hypothetical protein